MRRAIITTALTAIIAAAAFGCGSDVPTLVPTLPEATCGSAVGQLDSSGMLIVAIAGHGSLTCFTAAARECKPASILIVERGTDTGDDVFFRIGQGGKPGQCPVTELEQPYSAEGGKYKVSGADYVGDITATQCRVASVTGRGVLIGCPGQPVIIPSAVNMPGQSQAPSRSA
jgi:hypothetical protein